MLEGEICRLLAFNYLYINFRLKQQQQKQLESERRNVISRGSSPRRLPARDLADGNQNQIVFFANSNLSIYMPTRSSFKKTIELDAVLSLSCQAGRAQSGKGHKGIWLLLLLLFLPAMGRFALCELTSQVKLIPSLGPPPKKLLSFRDRSSLYIDSTRGRIIVPAEVEIDSSFFDLNRNGNSNYLELAANHEINRSSGSGASRKSWRRYPTCWPEE